ncbi:MAG TPA: hypothetical protein VIG85_07370 [Comamonas sp.]
MHKLFEIVGAAMAVALAAPAAAAQWQICDYKVRVQDTQPSRQALYVDVLSVQSKGGAECRQPGTFLAFKPETWDYQSELPRRQWPKPGQTVTVRHRYLDGICKNIGACRIQHYSPQLRIR